MCGLLEWIVNLFSGGNTPPPKPEPIVDVSVSRPAGKYALLVGIDEYNNPKMNLMGCVPDILQMKEVLIDRGFRNKNIRVLINDKATKKNILDLLEQMIVDSIPGDELVFQFSGHGSQVPDLNGDEPDKLDEILIPYDLDWYGNYISDDDIAERFKKLPQGVFLSMISDSCHSGTISRDIKSRTKYISPPAHMLQLIFSTKDLKLNPIGMRTDGGSQRHVLLAGCRSTQTSESAVIDGAWHGVLTYYFIKSLNNKETWRDCYISLLDMIGASRHEQTPQLTGSEDLINRPVFGGRNG